MAFLWIAVNEIRYACLRFDETNSVLLVFWMTEYLLYVIERYVQETVSCTFGICRKVFTFKEEP